jgi:hypothetical protein
MPLENRVSMEYPFTFVYGFSQKGKTLNRKNAKLVLRGIPSAGKHGDETWSRQIRKTQNG